MAILEFLEGISKLLRYRCERRGKLFWGSPKASRIKASQPHFPRFRVRIFHIVRVLCGFDPWKLLRHLFFWVRGTFRIFRIFAVSGSNCWFRKCDRPALLLKKIYQRIMTIWVASPFWDNLGHGHRLFLSRNKFSEDHDHMCQKVFSRESWSWSSSFSLGEP